MVITRKTLVEKIEDVVIDIPPNKHLFVVNFTTRKGIEDIQCIWTDTLNGYIDVHDNLDYEVLGIFTYVLVSEKTNHDVYDWLPNYEGKRFN